jgi:rare lipoprotein A
MKTLTKNLRVAMLAVAALVTIPAAQAASDEEAIAVQRAIAPDRSGKSRTGIASFYHRMFVGRKMADGNLFDANGINAASRSLPLGTLALVTNVENMKSAIVRIQDRGPYAGSHRIVDLSPRIAEELGITHKGLAKVEVAPIVVPLPDGTVRIGDAASTMASTAIRLSGG